MQSRRFLLIAGAWLLSAAGAFSLGRATIKQVQASTALQAKTATPSAAPAPAGATTPKLNEDEFSLAGWFGSKASGLTEVLNGRSLEDHVKHLLKQDDEAIRMLGFLRLLEALEKPEDIKAVLDVIGKDQRGGFRSTEQALLLQKWAKIAPTDAAAYANSQRDWSRFNGLNAVLKTWVKSNPEEAIAWAEKNGVQQGADGQPGGPGRGGPGGEDGNWAVATLIGSLSKTSLDRALQVAAEQPYSRARGRMADTLVSELISQRGADAARDTVMGIADEQFQAGMARELAQRMARENPQDAASWANGLPAGETRQRAMAEVIQEWAQKDAVAAGTYLQGLGNSPEFDRARQDYARSVVRIDPEAAWPWTEAITDPERRAETQQEVLGSLARRDQEAAKVFAQTHGVEYTPTNRGGGPGGGNFGRRGGR
jgi:hypothetical protein